MSRLRLLIIGGYGVFGGRIVELLEQEPRLTLIVAGRSLAKAQDWCAGRQAKATLEPTAFDRDGDVTARLDALKPDIVIDASGPFQAYGDSPYRLIEACINAGVNYLDLADGSDFVAGVSTYDEAARQRAVFALSGVSSFPVLTAAVVRRLAQGFDTVEEIHGGIAPSPYAGVGENVIRAIATYAGQPVTLQRRGRTVTAYPFTEQMRRTISPGGKAPVKHTLFSLVDVPDLQALRTLWPQAQTIWMGAGPVPQVLHRLLIGLAWLTRKKLIPTLLPLAGLMRGVMNHVRWGEHRGGMFVDVTGVRDGRRLKRSWHLLAEGSDGPFIPAMAIEAVIRKVLDGKAPQPGARACLSDVELEDYQALFAQRAITTGIRDDSAETTLPLYRAVLGEAWEKLPEPLRAMHDLPRRGARLVAEGRASVERGRSPLSRIAAWFGGFTEASNDTPLKVEFQSHGGTETWLRTFGGQSFESRQYAGFGKYDGLLCEKFGPLTFAMALTLQGEKLGLEMRHWDFFGLPLPTWLCPRSDAYETDADGRFNFHVRISHPLTGLIVRYQGWLAPVQADSVTGVEASAPSSRHSPEAQSVQPAPVAPEAASVIDG